MSRPTAEERFWSRVDKETASPCWLWTGTPHHTGYGHIWIDGKKYSAHRVSYEWTHGTIPEGMLVCHTCDTPLCVNPEHLFLGTIADNMTDRDGKGRGARGERMGNSKLSEDEVRSIKNLLARGDLTVREIANQFNVSSPTISHIKSGRCWGWLD